MKLTRRITKESQSKIDYALRIAQQSIDASMTVSPRNSDFDDVIFNHGKYPLGISWRAFAHESVEGSATKERCADIVVSSFRLLAEGAS